MKKFIQIRNYKNLLPFMLSVLFLMGCKEKTDSKPSNGVVLSGEPPLSDLAQDLSIKDEKLNNLFQGYLAIKSSLVSSNAAAVVENVNSILDLTIIQEGPISEVLRGMLVPDLESQRRYFSELGGLLEPLLVGQIQSGYIYKQFCPMAFNNNGGYWFSDSEAILNPYFGEAMLRCGTLAKTFSPL